MAAFKWTAARVKGVFGALTTPAEDPREQYANVRETHLDSLGRLRAAREEVETTLDRLNVLADKAQQSLNGLETSAASSRGSDRFTAELKRDLTEELSALKRQVETLMKQQEHLVLTERRLVSSLRRGAVTRELEGASDTSRQAHDLARSTLATSPEIRGLDRAIDSARLATERLQDRALTIDKMASLGARLGDDRQGSQSRDLRLMDRYAIALENAPDDQSRRVVQAGLEVLRNLMYEHEQLRGITTNNVAAKGVGSARIEILAAQAYKGALDSLEHALEASDRLSNVGQESRDEAGSPSRAEELIAVAARREETIRAAKVEMLSIDPDRPESGVLGAEERLKESGIDLRNVTPRGD